MWRLVTIYKIHESPQQTTPGIKKKPVIEILASSRVSAVAGWNKHKSALRRGANFKDKLKTVARLGSLDRGPTR